MKEIKITQGQVALVDDEDYERLMAIGSWHASYSKITKSFYARRSHKFDGRYSLIRMHRVVLNITDIKIHVDHINHDTLDNRKENLRQATRSQNQCNRRINVNNTSGHRGVSWSKHDNKWYAQIRIDNKGKNLGRFTNINDAVDAYKKAAKELHGEFTYNG